MTEPDLAVERFRAGDGTELAYRELGEGRPLILVHGYFSTGYVNWVKYGHARLLAEAGYRVVMPDLRGHGESAKPHDPAAYPPDVLADDGFALVDHLGLGAGGYDLGGYSLGARTVMRMLVRGAPAGRTPPDRAMLGGMGLERMLDMTPAIAYYRRVLAGYGSFRHGEPEFMAQAFLKTVGGDPEALRLVIEASVPTSREEIGAIDVPTLVLLGDQDDDHGSGARLAELLPRGRYAQVPGSHMGAVARPELGAAIADWLGPAEEMAVG